VIRLRVMYWKEIPVNIQITDKNNTTTSHQLPERFQEAVDRIAMFDGSFGTDDYLEGWGYGPYLEVDGDPEKILLTLTEKFERLPNNLAEFVADTWKNKTRDETPGAINHIADIKGL